MFPGLGQKHFYGWDLETAAIKKRKLKFRCVTWASVEKFCPLVKYFFNKISQTHWRKKVVGWQRIYHPFRTGKHIYAQIYIFWHNYSNLCSKLHVLINNFYSAAWNFFPFTFLRLLFIHSLIYFTRLISFLHPSIHTFSPSSSSIDLPVHSPPLASSLLTC